MGHNFNIQNSFNSPCGCVKSQFNWMPAYIAMDIRLPSVHRDRSQPDAGQSARAEAQVRVRTDKSHAIRMS